MMAGTRGESRSLSLPQADPAEIAAVVAYLASPLADYITGQAISVDGGLVMG